MKQIMFFLLLFLIYQASAAKSTVDKLKIYVCNDVISIEGQNAKKIKCFFEFENIENVKLFLHCDSILFFENMQIPGTVRYSNRKFVQNEKLQDINNQVLLINDKSEVFYKKELNHEGRIKLVLASGLFSLHYGNILPYAYGIIDIKNIETISILTIGSAGFLIPLKMTKEHDITKSMSMGFIYGSLIGNFIGYELYYLTKENREIYNIDLGYGAAVGALSGIITLRKVISNDLERGHIALMGSGGIWGYAFGKHIPLIINSSNIRSNAALAISFTGLGALGGHYLGKNHPSLKGGDVSVINIMGVIGLMIPVSFFQLLNYNTNELLYSVAFLSAFTGIGIGINKTVSHDYNIKNGLLMYAGTFSGILLGNFLNTKITDSYKTEPLFITTGAISGFMLTDLFLKKTLNNSLKGGINNNIEFGFNPLQLYYENDSNIRHSSYLFYARLKF